jgi:hypothetical protein
MKLLSMMVAAVALVGVVGCEIPLRMSDGRVFPRYPAFSIQPEAVSEDAGLDFDAVYYKARDNRPGMVGHPVGDYYRFWPNGRVLKTAARGDGPPAAAEADGFWNADLGYYRVRGNRVEVEFYVPNAAGSYYFSGPVFIDRDGNLLQIRPRRGKELLRRFVYRRIPLKGMTREPDW